MGEGVADRDIQEAAVRDMLEAGERLRLPQVGAILLA
jgi:hypothetical protein